MFKLILPLSPASKIPLPVASVNLGFCVMSMAGSVGAGVTPCIP